MTERKTRKDGEPKRSGGGNVNPQPHGGAIGNPPHEPTDDLRGKVQAHAANYSTIEDIASILQLSPSTIKKHYHDEYTRGRAIRNAEIGSSVIKRAKAGDWESQKLILQTQAGWVVPKRVIVEGNPQGAPVRYQDLSGLTDEELDALAVISGKLATTGSDTGGDQPAEE